MADDNRDRGYRAGTSYGRPRPGAAQPSGDPLAELARLIGQQSEPDSSYRQAGARKGYTEPHDVPADEQWSAPDSYTHHESYDSDARGPRAPRYPGASHAHNEYGEAQYEPPYESGSSYGGYHGQADRRSDDRAGYAYPDPAPHDVGAPGYSENAGYGTYSPGEQRYSDPYYEQSAYGQAPYAQDGMQPSSDDGSARRRGGIVTVLAVLALAVVGTAAAFGYRAMFGNSGAPVPPPVIKADTKPSKVVPATDPNAKPIQDRVGVQTERIVPREEQPLDARDAARGGQPRVAFPNLAGQQPASNAAPTGAVPPTSPAEPKRIRTVTIRPDQPVETPRSQPQTRNTASVPATVEDLLNSARAQPAPTPSNGPLALSPTAPTQQQQQQPQSQQQNQRQAARTNPATSPFPAPIASTSAPSGGYAVQVTSQRSEADAQASYKSLQQQFPSVLGSRQSVIRRADLGDKGTYYRAQIPFSSQSEANEFCSSLKAAGGQCVVQKN